MDKAKYKLCLSLHVFYLCSSIRTPARVNIILQGPRRNHYSTIALHGNAGLIKMLEAIYTCRVYPSDYLPPWRRRPRQVEMSIPSVISSIYYPHPQVTIESLIKMMGSSV